MICCPSALNKFPFNKSYYSIFGKKCLLFGNIICYPFKCNDWLVLLSLWALVTNQTFFHNFFSPILCFFLRFFVFKFFLAIQFFCDQKQFGPFFRFFFVKNIIFAAIFFPQIFLSKKFFDKLTFLIQQFCYSLFFSSFINLFPVTKKYFVTQFWSFHN